MNVKNMPLAARFLFCLLIILPAVTEGKEKHKPAGPNASGAAVLWANPADIEARDLYYGPGGRGHVPQGTVTFLKEDLDGTNPKFTVKDQDGTKWKVKLGIEARPETVATRIVWAIGYFANEDYFIEDLQVNGMPARLHRGQNLIGPNGSVRNVRLKREPADDKKTASWVWRQNPFTGTRELNGLRTLMAVLNNWDLKDVNNAVYQQDDKRIYMISDLGASFGSPGRSWPRDKAKGNLDNYRKSAFIRRVTPLSVDFQTPARPRFVYLVNPKEYFSRVHLEWIGRNIPRADAKWVGALLARLSPQQIHDAFRAAGYQPEEADQFYRILEGRIGELTDL